jgi:hypothetical protein
MCAKMKNDNEMLVMVALKGEMLGWCSTNGGSFALPNSPIGEGKKLRRWGDEY